MTQTLQAATGSQEPTRRVRVRESATRKEGISNG